MNQLNFAELISKMAHELRSPLTSIKGFSSTLMKRWDRFDDEQRLQFVETIHADGERMGRIVSEILDLARLEANRLELNPVSANLKTVAETALGQLKQLPGSDRIEVAIEDDLTAWGDVDRLGHVFYNLMENAIKFSDEGPISVTAQRVGDRVEVRVVDAGVGIDPPMLERVFAGPAPAGQKAGPSGAGLGLYLSKRLVDVHKGSIEATSTPGEGSTFIVSLPARRPEPS